MLKYLSNLLSPVPQPDGFNLEGKYVLVNKALVRVYKGRQYLTTFEKDETSIILKIEDGLNFVLGLEKVWDKDLNNFDPNILLRKVGSLPTERGNFLFSQGDWWIGPFYLLHETEELSLETLAEAQEVIIEN